MTKKEICTLNIVVTNVSGTKEDKEYNFYTYETTINGVKLEFFPKKEDKKALEIILNNYIEKSVDKK